jgi:hypothetical protein
VPAGWFPHGTKHQAWWQRTTTLHPVPCTKDRAGVLLPPCSRTFEIITPQSGSASTSFPTSVDSAMGSTIRSAQSDRGSNTHTCIQHFQSFPASCSPKAQQWCLPPCQLHHSCTSSCLLGHPCLNEHTCYLCLAAGISEWLPLCRCRECML